LKNHHHQIALTVGDPAGIGPEILISMLIRSPKIGLIDCKVFAPRMVLEECAHHFGDRLKVSGDHIEGEFGKWPLANCGVPRMGWTPGRPAQETAKAAWDAIDLALSSVLSGESNAMVTGPIHKAQMLQIGFPEAGHTGYLALKTRSPGPVMLYDSPRLKVALATTHIPFCTICKNLSWERLFRVCELTLQYLKLRGISQPRIAVAGLNPHAGSGDFFGDEEETIISPAIQRLLGRGDIVFGPVAPDTVFHRCIAQEWDAVVALYHDQGSIPVKTIDFEGTVNVTLGLPVIRTSVDHGTAFDIAGKDRASYVNYEAAVELAAELASRKYGPRSDS
jgi:4-hydroxythreonine-4-phosphate dehydrogenase